MRVFITTGELSGDMHAARLLAALAEHPSVDSLQATALGSVNLKAAGATVLYDTAVGSAMGVFSNLMLAPSHVRLFRRTLRRILRDRPDAVILVDWRFFNLKLAKALRGGGYDGTIVHYIAPVLWQAASDERFQRIAEQPKSFRRRIGSRFEQMRESVDLALAIYPVGLKLFEHFGVNYSFIGHPLCDQMRPKLAEGELRKLVGAEGEVPLIGLMPGSRREEVSLIGLELVRAARLIAEKMPTAVFALPVALPGLRDSLLGMAKSCSVDIKLLEPEQRYDLLTSANLMIVASGTATHECAIAGAPHVAVYKVRPLYDFLYATFTRFRLPAYAFPNIIAGRHVVPELVRGDCSSAKIAHTALALLSDTAALDRMRDDLAQVRQRICRPRTVETAADLIVDAIHSRLR